MTELRSVKDLKRFVDSNVASPRNVVLSISKAVIKELSNNNGGDFVLELNLKNWKYGRAGIYRGFVVRRAFF